MPITRTPIVDDSGGGTDGTVLNNAWKQQLYDQIDQTVAATGLSGELDIPLAAATYHNLTYPNMPTTYVWYMNTVYAPSVDLTGVIAEADGTEHLLISNSPNPLKIYADHTGSSLGNRFITPGYSTYTLTVWRSVRIIYLLRYGMWLVQQP